MESDDQTPGNLARRLMEEFRAALADAPGLEEASSVLERLLQSAAERLDLVTREEFDTQTRLLERLRQKVEVLQQRLDGFDDDKQDT